MVHVVPPWAKSHSFFYFLSKISICRSWKISSGRLKTLQNVSRLRRDFHFCTVLQYTILVNFQRGAFGPKISSGSSARQNFQRDTPTARQIKKNYGEVPTADLGGSASSLRQGREVCEKWSRRSVKLPVTESRSMEKSLTEQEKTWLCMQMWKKLKKFYNGKQLWI